VSVNYEDIVKLQLQNTVCHLDMPPKKKKDDSKRKEKKISKKSFGGPQAQDQLNDQSREYYLTQIKDLENRIDWFVRCRSKISNLYTISQLARCVHCDCGDTKHHTGPKHWAPHIGPQT